MSEYCRDDFGLVEQADDDFKMWQGLVGPHYTPSVSEDGTLSWSNDGQLPNPEDVSIKGPQGDPGPTGEPGPGVPAGGTTGQILAKASDEDYDGEWIDPPEMDAGQVSYDSTETYDDGTVGKELTTINSALTSLSAVTEIIDTASGAIASFPDGSGLPMRSLVAQINPVQDLHGYDNPWPAGGGNNLLDPDEIEVIGSANIHCFYDNGFLLKANTAYTFSVSDAAAGLYLQKYSDSSNVAVSYGKTFVTYTPTEDILIMLNAYYSGQYPVPSGGLSSVKCQLEIGSSASPWQPYSNECPISGWTGLTWKRCGKNLLPNETFLSSNGRTLAFGQDTSSTTYKTYLKSGINYTLTTTPPDSNISYKLYVRNSAEITELDSNATGTHTITFSVLQTGFYSVYAYSSSGYTFPDNNYFTNFQLEVGSTASTYEEYTGEAISVSFGQTVYGGSDEIVGGQGTSTMATVDLGTLDWVKNANQIKTYFQTSIADAKKSTDNSVAQNFICSQYATQSWINTLDRAGYDCSIAEGWVGKSNFVIYDSTKESMTAEEFKTAMSGVQLCYELATPQTFTHTGQSVDTLVGQNNVFVDTGDVTVTYQASIKGYIDKVLGQ